MFKKSSTNHVGAETLTIVGAEAIFHGSITVRGSVRVDGEMEGNIAEAQEIVIGSGGRVRGNICAVSVDIGGEVRGDVVCSEAIRLKAGAKLIGNIRSPKLFVEEGATFDGNCSMTDAAVPVAAEVG